MRSITIAQISDLHVSVKQGRFFSGRRDRGDALARCVSTLNTLNPDVVIATGDLTHGGREEEYTRLRDLLGSLNPPIFLLPGNHDDRLALRNVFSDQAYLFAASPHIAYTFDVGPVRVIGLDSTDRPRIGGYLDELRVSWLQQKLEEARGQPTILALHHPPFKTGVWPMDTFAFAKVNLLADMVRRSSHVQRVISGHVHCAQAVQWEQTVACTCPTPWSQLLLRSIAGKPVRPVIERAGFLLHSLDGSGRITTRAVRLNGAIEQLC